MSDDVEYEFVKGQGWVPRLKKEALKPKGLMDYVHVEVAERLRHPGFTRAYPTDDEWFAEPEAGTALLEEYRPYARVRREPIRGREEYDFEMFCRDVRIERVDFMGDIYRATYRRRATRRDHYARQGNGERDYCVEFRNDGVRSRTEALRQLYNAVYGIDTRRCERCGVQGQLERVDQRFLTCRYCGRYQRG